MNSFSNHSRSSSERDHLIVEVYHDWTPPRKVARVIQTLLDYAPDNYLTGLKEVVLTNASSLPRERRRSKAKGGIPVKEVMGLYHPATKNEKAWIEIFVDNALKNWPKWTTRITPFLSFAMGEVLYHEVAHHRQFILKATSMKTERNEDLESFADRVGKDLNTIFLIKKYWFFVKPVRYMGGFFPRAIKSITSGDNR